jgi:hypothetical protein
MMTTEQAAIAKGLLARGEKQHDIAAFLGVNGGRIAEIKTGVKFADVKPAVKKDLPTSADMASGHALFLAEQAIHRAMLGLQQALAYVQDMKSKSDA